MKKIFVTLLPSVLLFFVLGTALVNAQGARVPTSGPGTGSQTSGPGGTSPTSGPGGSVPTSKPINIKITNPLNCGEKCTLVDFLKKIVDELVLPIGAIIAVLAFIYTGFQFVMAQGNPGKLTTARTALLYTAIGTALLLGAWVFANVIRGTVNQLITP